MYPEIPEDAVILAWEETENASDDQFRRQVGYTMSTQPDLFAFVLEATEDLSEERRALAVHLALVVFRAYEIAFPDGLAVADDDAIQEALDASQRWVGNLGPEVFDDSDDPLLGPPAVHHLLVEILFDLDRPEPPPSEEQLETGVLLAIMKTLTTVLSRCVEAGPAR